MSITNGTPASSQIIAMENMVAKRDAEIDRLRELLARQYEADAALYAMPDDCTAEDHAAALAAHDAVHLALAAELTPNLKSERGEPR